MSNKLVVISFIISVLLVFVSCEKENGEQSPAKGIISFSFSLSEKGINARKQSNDFSLVVSAMVTITKEDGTATEYTKRELEVYESEGVLYCEEVALSVGKYLVTELVLKDGEGAALFAIPQAAKLQEYIEQLLPVPFEVIADSTPKTVILQVLSTLGFTPEEFGFDPEEVKFKPLLYFWVALRDKYDMEKYLQGDLVINASSNIQVDSAAKVILDVAYEEGLEIGIRTFAGGYLDERYLFPIDSLLQHQEVPLLIKLQKIQEVENTYIGNIMLTSQEEVDEFGKRNFESVIGNLIIDDKEESVHSTIVSLDQLKSILKVEGSFTVRDNPFLVNFSGMNLTEVTGGFILEDNPNVGELSGLQNFRKLGSRMIIINNSSLKDYCAISKLFYESPEVSLKLEGNAYNPSKEEIKDYKACSVD